MDSFKTIRFHSFISTMSVSFFIHNPLCPGCADADLEVLRRDRCGDLERVSRSTLLSRPGPLMGGLPANLAPSDALPGEDPPISPSVRSTPSDIILIIILCYIIIIYWMWLTYQLLVLGTWFYECPYCTDGHIVFF